MNVIVSLCCNDHRNGLFAGRLTAVEYHDMDLMHGDCFHGCAISFPDLGVVRISRRTFRFNQRKEWYGNWCWDALSMQVKEARRLVRYLHDSGCWTCDGGPVKLCDWFDAREPMTPHMPTARRMGL